LLAEDTPLRQVPAGLRLQKTGKIFLGTIRQEPTSILSNKAARLRAATLSPTNQPRTETLYFFLLKPTLLTGCTSLLCSSSESPCGSFPQKPTPHGDINSLGSYGPNRASVPTKTLQPSQMQLLQASIIALCPNSDNSKYLPVGSGVGCQVPGAGSGR
jgi:hypothetical protein